MHFPFNICFYILPFTCFAHYFYVVLISRVIVMIKQLLETINSTKNVISSGSENCTTCIAVCILTRPTGSSKQGTTRENNQRYHTRKRLIRYIYRDFYSWFDILRSSPTHAAHLVLFPVINFVQSYHFIQQHLKLFLHTYIY